MAVTLIIPSAGRGAWRGVGGTLNGAGTAPGPYYRAPGAGASVAMPGLAGYRAVKAGVPVDVNDYAVYRAVQALQVELNLVADGLFGNDTATRLKAWQTLHGLTPDGVLGPTSAGLLWRGLTETLVRSSTITPTVLPIACGHLQWESAWDAGAVGSFTPQDLGLGQINGLAHPTLTPEFRTNPRTAIPFVAGLVMDNLNAMGNERDAIAAYNLGITGARRWVAAGRPQFVGATDVWQYIAEVQKAQP